MMVWQSSPPPRRGSSETRADLRALETTAEKALQRVVYDLAQANPVGIVASLVNGSRTETTASPRSRSDWTS
jgi:hypothetical protein